MRSTTTPEPVRESSLFDIGMDLRYRGADMRKVTGQTLFPEDFPMPSEKIYFACLDGRALAEEWPFPAERRRGYHKSRPHTRNTCPCNARSLIPAACWRTVSETLRPLVWHDGYLTAAGREMIKQESIVPDNRLLFLSMAEVKRFELLRRQSRPTGFRIGWRRFR